MSVPVLPFSKVRHAGSLVFLAGELPLSENGSIPDGIGPQTDLTLRRIAATLAGEGLSDGGRRILHGVSCRQG